MFSNVDQSCAVWYDSSAKRPVMRISFSSMIDVSAVPPLPHSVKLFIGGLEFEMGRDDVARVASHFSGSWVPGRRCCLYELWQKHGVRCVPSQQQGGGGSLPRRRARAPASRRTCISISRFSPQCPQKPWLPHRCHRTPKRQDDKPEGDRTLLRAFCNSGAVSTRRTALPSLRMS